MKMFILLVCIFLGTLFYLKSQSVWEHLYSNGQTVSFRPRAAYNDHPFFQMPDKGYWVLTDSAMLNNWTQPTKLLRINSNGQLIRDVRIINYPNSPSFLSDKTFISHTGVYNPSGSDTCFCLLNRFDTTGIELWRTCLMKHDTIHNYIPNFSMEYNNDILTFGTKQKGYYTHVGINDIDTLNFIVCTNIFGHIKWKRFYSFYQDYDQALVSAAIMPNKDFLVIGSKSTTGTSSLTPFISRIDTNGLIKFIQPLSGITSLKSINRFLNNKYLILGTSGNQTTLTCIDSAANIIWQQSYGGSRFDFPFKLLITDNNQIVVLNSTNSFSLTAHHDDIWLFKTDSNGNFIWGRIYNTLYDFSQTGCICVNGSIIETSDNGFLIKTERRFPLANGNMDAGLWLIKTDSLGNVYYNNLNGTIFNDTDQNCQYGANNDIPIPENILRIDGGQYPQYTITDNGGLYNLSIDTGSYQFTPIPRSLYQESCQISYSIHLPNIVDTNTFNFPIKTNAYCPLMEGSLIGGRMRPGIMTSFFIKYTNTGTTIANQAKAIVKLPNLFNVTSASNYFTNVDSTYTFQLGNVSPFGSGTISINGYLNSSAQMGDILTSTLQLIPDTVCINGYTDHPARDTIFMMVINSFDPNEKNAFPLPKDSLGFGGQVFPNQEIAYTIYFQNTGNDIAYQVILKDSLPLNLNIEKIRAGAASFPYDFEIKGRNTIQFKFDNINLLPKSVDEPKSIGFVKFYIPVDTIISQDSLISNSAYIYFDNNLPIVTNTVTHCLACTTINNSNIDLPVSFKINPNPAHDFINISWSQPLSLSSVISMVNIIGDKIQETKIEKGSHSALLDSKNITNGLYIIKISNNSVNFHIGKVIIAH